MKRSKVIPLVLLGTLTVTACGEDETESRQLQQQQYKSVADCQKDWGTDQRNCQQQPNGHGGFLYMGPRYYYDHSYGYPVAVNNDGTTRIVPNSYISSRAPSTAVGTFNAGRVAGVSSVARGGFGATGAAHAASSGG